LALSGEETMADDDEDTFTFVEELERVKYAIERLASHPHAAAGACLRGLSPTAIDVSRRR
jgi:hypothetical protein